MINTILTIFLSILAYAIISIIIGFVIMLLWNCLMPVLFKLQQIDYIQGYLISLLSSLIFKGK